MAAPETADPGQADARARPWTAAAVLIAAALPIWAFLGGPPLTSSSDGRYAAASRYMADHDTWLIPHIDGEPHLTKPPLIYWAEAAAVEALGPTEFAVRLPSALAATLLLVGTFWFARRLYGTGVGMLAAGMLAMMPLFVVVARLTLTDMALTLFWSISLAGGFLAVREPGRLRWPALLWAGVALGWLTKPLAPWGAVGILAVWLVIARQWRSLLRLRPFSGLVLSLAPVAAWGLLVYQQTPELLEVWDREVVERAKGGGRHAEPFWYLFVVFLVAMFPATGMLELPGVNQPLRRWKRWFAEGGDRAFLVLATIMPVIAFSIPQGKLPTYILPAAPPLAILTALMLAKWLGPWGEGPADDERLPDVRYTFGIAVSGATLTAIVGGFVVMDGRFWWAPLPFALMVLAAAWLWRTWQRGPKARRRGAAVVFACWVACCIWGDWLATSILGPTGPDALYQRIQRETGIADPAIYTIYHRNYALAFYSGRPAPVIGAVESPADPRTMMDQAIDTYGRSLVVVCQDDNWEKFADAHPDYADAFEIAFDWSAIHTTKTRLILTLREGSTP